MGFFESIKRARFQVLAYHHAEAILTQDMPDAIADLESALQKAEIPIEELIEGGGGESQFTQRLRKDLADRLGWEKHSFEIQKTGDGVEEESVTHVVDHVKHFKLGTFALEIEWNNKDPFFDRDLENFKRLHAEGAISIGAIITRGSSLQEGIPSLLEDYAKRKGIKSPKELESFYTPTARQLALYQKATKSHGSFARGWAEAFAADKFGESTTHWRKLEEKVSRGAGNPCPLLLIGLPISLVRVHS